MRPLTLDELSPPHVGEKRWPWSASSRRLSSSIPDGRLWPRISIVTPSYNQGKFLEEAIRSVILQGYPNLEYIVIDGGSTDNSVEIIQRYAPWLTFWQSKKDRGQSHAINQGFERVTGDILAWLNSDDVYAPEALSKVSRYLAGKAGALLIGSSILTEGPDKLEGKTDTRKPRWHEILYEARTFPQPSVFWTRDLWERVGGVDEELDFAMDYDLGLRMYPQAEEVIFVDDVLSYARSHVEQKGARAKREGRLDHFTVQRAYAAVRVARRQRGPTVFWLLVLWLRRVRKAIVLRNWTLLKGSAFHRAATKMILYHKKPDQL